MAVGRADTYDQRAEILGRIITRNRVVTALRIRLKKWASASAA